jgi:NAD-dependent histone deacetylase SIR2
MMDSSSPPSSPLSSVGSLSPPAGLNYPSPASSSLPATRVPSEAGDVPESAPDRDGPPPAKKRKITEPKPRTTEYLDLRRLGAGTDEEIKHQDEQLKRLVSVLQHKRKIVVIAGAGISVSAGSMSASRSSIIQPLLTTLTVPDFRSSHGLFSTLRSQHKLKTSGKALFDASVYKDDSSTSSFHSMVRQLSHLTKKAEPTDFHHMLASIAEEGRLLRLYSQNVDGIDTSLPPLATKVPLNRKGPWPKTIQLHGGLEKMVCSKCGHIQDFDGALFEGPEAPPCPECEETDMVRTASGLRSHGIGRMRPRMVLYNEYNPDEEAIGAVSAADLKKVADAVIVVGTSLKIPGIRRLVKEMCKETRDRRGGFTAWINLEGEPGLEFKDCWDLVVRGECDEVAQYAALPIWNDKDIGEFKVITAEDEATKEKRALDKVLITSANVEAAQAFPTPGASPREQSPTPANAFAEILKAKPKADGLLKKAAANKAGKKGATTQAKKSRASKKSKTPLPVQNIKLALPISKATGTGEEKKKMGEKSEEKPTGNTAEPAKTRKPLPNTPTRRDLFPGLSTGLSKPVIQIPLHSTAPKVDSSTKIQSLSRSEIPALPHTPSPSPTSGQAFRHTTISPPSYPNGMRFLLSDES